MVQTLMKKERKGGRNREGKETGANSDPTEKKKIREGNHNREGKDNGANPDPKAHEKREKGDKTEREKRMMQTLTKKIFFKK